MRNRTKNLLIRSTAFCLPGTLTIHGLTGRELYLDIFLKCSHNSNVKVKYPAAS